jgi:hypothetical protein
MEATYKQITTLQCIYNCKKFYGTGTTMDATYKQIPTLQY